VGVDEVGRLIVAEKLSRSAYCQIIYGLNVHTGQDRGQVGFSAPVPPHLGDDTSTCNHRDSIPVEDPQHRSHRAVSVIDSYQCAGIEHGAQPIITQALRRSRCQPGGHARALTNCSLPNVGSDFRRHRNRQLIKPFDLHYYITYQGTH